jgi:hypothetical protein
MPPSAKKPTNQPSPGDPGLAPLARRDGPAGESPPADDEPLILDDDEVPSPGRPVGSAVGAVDGSTQDPGSSGTDFATTGRHRVGGSESVGGGLEAPTDPGLGKSPVDGRSDSGLGVAPQGGFRRMGAGYLALVLLAVAGLSAMWFGLRYSTDWVAALGEGALDATRAIHVVFGIAALTSVYIAGRSLLVRGDGQSTLDIVNKLASEGATAAEVARFAEECTAAQRNEFRSRVSEFANIQVLLGMLLTAVWLASQAPQFEIASAALTSSGTGGMAGIVAGLLKLGPKAFVSTAAAVSSALVIILIGSSQAVVYGALLPSRAEVLERWRGGADRFRSGELALQVGRTEELVARAVSVSQVQEMQTAFVTSMNAMASLLDGAGKALEDFRQTAVLIQAANERLSGVSRSLEAAQVNVQSVAGGLAALTRQVESYGEKLLASTSDFTAQLIKESSERIPQVVSVATNESIRQLKENVLPAFAQDLHQGMQRSASAIQQQYSDAFSYNLMSAQDNLARVSTLSAELEDRTVRLAGELQRTAHSWSDSAGKLVVTVGEVGDAFASAAGHGDGAAKATEAARASLERAAVSAASAARDLGGLAESAREQLESIRHDAELLGQIKEAVRAGGERRVRS